MKKTVTKTKDIKETKYYCDCCGVEFHWGCCSSYMNHCWVCKNMICDDCRKVSTLDNDTDLWHHTYEDERYICRDCEKIAGPYFEKLNILWETYLEQKRDIQKELRILREKKKNEFNKTS